MFRMATACRAEKAMALKPAGIVRALQIQLEPTFCLVFHSGGRIASATLHREVPCSHFESGQDLGWFGSRSAWNLFHRWVCKLVLWLLLADEHETTKAISWP